MIHMRFYWLLLPALFIPGLLQAQGVNDQLRQFFSTIATAPDQAPFLFEMTLHEIEDNWFVPVNQSDTADAHIWWTVYYEMQQAAYDPQFLPETFELQRKAGQRSRQDTIPIGILDFEFNRFKPNAWDSGVFFGWHDSFLYDIPGSGGHPYEVNSHEPARGTRHDVFCATPLQNQSDFRDVVFEINPAFIFYGPPYSSFIDPEEHTISINFGDGSGWLAVDPDKTSHFHITYPGKNLYKIEVKVTHDAMVRYSQSTIVVRSDRISIQPDAIIDEIPGIKAGIYYACKKQRLLEKVLIAVSGFDLLESQTVPRIYEQLISEPRLIMLRNYGYDIICVDWTDSKDDLKANGDRLINLIELLKCRTLNIEHNFTIVGISMGALISNYALTKMESPDYLAEAERNPQICYPGQMHNTRTFISLEGEYQGAFINIGAQRLAGVLKGERLASRLPSYTVNSFSVDARFIRDEVLSRIGVKQMLMHHVDSTDGNGRYYPHTERIRFLQYMESIGNYPRFVKTIAMSNALAGGQNQVAIGNKLAKSGDMYYQVVLNFQLRLFGKLKLPIHFSTRLNSHPGNQVTPSPVLTYRLVCPRKLNLKGCLRKIVTLGTCSKCSCVLNHDTEELLELSEGIPWDVMCGGRISSATAVFDGQGDMLYSVSGIKKLHPAGYLSYALTSNAQTGQAKATALYRIGGYTKAGGWKWVPVAIPLIEANMDVLAELESFNFVPWMSAFDYRRPDSLSQDLLTTLIDSNLARTPFDVLISRQPHEDFPVTFPFPNEGQRHYEHREMRADTLENEDDLTMLSREIGEMEMYLDNRVINRHALFEAVTAIQAGSNANPLYRTPTHSGSKTYDALWSRDDGCDVTENGMLSIRAGKVLRLTPGFVVSNGGEFHGSIKKMQVCHYSLDELREMKGFTEDTSTTSIHHLPEVPSVQIFPNPAQSVVIVQTDNTGHCSMYGLTGRLYYAGLLQKGENHIPTSALSTGLYFIQVEMEGRVSTFKLVKQ